LRLFDISTKFASVLMIKRSLVSQLLFFIQHIGEAQRIQVPRGRAAKNYLELATFGAQDSEVSVSLSRSLHLPSCSREKERAQ
jgi:hypothetical protein